MRPFYLLTASIAAALTAMPAPASAVDLFPASDSELRPYNWTGFSIAPYFGYETLHLKGAGANVLKDPKGWRVGSEVDYDHQFGNLVLGIAGEGYYTGYENDGTVSSQLSSRLRDYGTVHARLGFTSGRWLVFGTGGYAFGDLSVKNSLTSIDDSKMLNGWTAGGGVEWVWNDAMTLRAEYQHISLGSEKFDTLPIGNQDLGADLDLFKIDFISRF